MEEEESQVDKRKQSRMRLVSIMVLLLLLGIGLYVMPIFLYPDNIVHEDSLSDFNNHTTNAQVTMEKGTYEVWMSTSFWTWFSLDRPVVSVNDTTGQPLHVDYELGNDERSIDGTECKHFATFTVSGKGDYNVTVVALLNSLGMPGSEKVYVVEERPASYAPMQWAGIIMIIVAIIGFIVILVLVSLTSSEEKQKRMRAQQPPGGYPPPGYGQYPQQHPPAGYGQYPPQQPPPPPPQQPPPPGYSPYPPQQPPQQGQARRGPPPY
ncbi:MAG: hypothetical protein JSW25_01145 [Thermoplasmata archaeon]|nr:MAG: hypothetical protein JSW25_01145 [Thermoplasmata archaeon]